MARWMIERKYERDRQLLQIVEVYAPNENKELVKAENKQWTYKKELIGADYR
ncbi:MAG TPA: hypothetical protein VK105_20370 [Virgibacillus sp.]|nr:hypothetical protein [Virgibacillus sp.]HLR69449.1 hypothetical protein [Virgibacillus sp.]